MEVRSCVKYALANRRHFCNFVTQSSYKPQTRCQPGLNFCRMKLSWMAADPQKMQKFNPAKVKTCTGVSLLHGKLTIVVLNSSVSLSVPQGQNPMRRLACGRNGKKWPLSSNWLLVECLLWTLPLRKGTSRIPASKHG